MNCGIIILYISKTPQKNLNFCVCLFVLYNSYLGKLIALNLKAIGGGGGPGSKYKLSSMKVLFNTELTLFTVC